MQEKKRRESGFQIDAGIHEVGDEKLNLKQREMAHFGILWPKGKNLLVLEFQIKYKVASFHCLFPSNFSSYLGW